MRLGLITICFLIATTLPISDAMAATPSSPPIATSTTPPASGPMYITDQIKVTLRSGPGLQYQIIKMLTTGDRVTVVKTTANGYTQVQLSGVEGWVLSRYLMATPPAAMQLAGMQQQLAQAKQVLGTTRQGLSQNQAQLSQLQQSKQQLQASYSALDQKYRALVIASQHAITLEKQNNLLIKEQKNNQERIKALDHANAELSQRTGVQWFLAGSGVLFGGLLIGLLLPKIAKRRRDNWFN